MFGEKVFPFSAIILSFVFMNCFRITEFSQFLYYIIHHYFSSLEVIGRIQNTHISFDDSPDHIVIHEEGGIENHDKYKLAKNS